MPRPELILFLFAIFTGVVSSQDKPVQFSRDVLPILSDRCFHCHGPDEATREADLRLDQRESAVEDRGDYQVVVPGKSLESHLLQRIISQDENELMPPPESGRKQLTPREMATIKKWIDQGAPWGKHWSFEKPVRPPLPLPDKQPIDSFVLSRLKESGLRPSPEASKRVLIRRVTLDLTGLPPTLEEVEEFLQDDSPQAFEKVADRLLKSPHYGERMVWPWLDAARYADTGGYQGDPDRTMWPWRDWVVNALNDNMPFDQFTIEQLAGDLLPQPTLEQRLATGFNRNHMHNSEGGRIAEETRVENVFDRAETTGTLWLGMTLQCARCHDHKFDPTSNEDYFRFFDFFNQTTEAGKTDRSVAVPPNMDYVPRNFREEKSQLDRRIQELTKRLIAKDATTDKQQTAWEKRLAKKSHNIWTPLQMNRGTSSNGATIQQRADRAIHVSGKRPEQDVYEIELLSTDKKITGIRLDALVDSSSPGKGTGRDENGNFVLTEIELWAKSRGSADKEYRRVFFSAAEADYHQGQYTIASAIDGRDGPRNGWAVSGHTIKKPRWAQLKLKEPLESEQGVALKFRLRFESEHTHHTLALFKLSVTGAADFKNADSAIAKIAAKKQSQRTPSESQQLRLYYREKHAVKYASISKQLELLKEQRKTLEAKSRPVKVMVMDTRKTPRDTFVLVKGIYNDRTDQKVQAAVPGMLPPIESTAGRRLNRMDLAKWIVSRENPLTARVTVNRFWQTFFGRGLVSTPNDFGLQGQQPSHPELLDWLAVDFMESGWDVKRLHKMIVMSDTYQQASRVTREHLEIDPENIFLARSSRYRLPSWMIRDQALAVSGLLQREIGGPPVRPYQPGGVWEEATFGKKKYSLDSGDKLYRRSVYTFWRRIIGPTMFFDSAKRQACEVKPNRTNTPLHALTTLNDITYVEAARFLAERAMSKHKTAEKRLEYLFLTLTSRLPNRDESQLLSNSLTKMVENYRDNPGAADELLAVGRKPRDKSLNPAEHAALTAIGNMLMNLDEVLVRP